MQGTNAPPGLCRLPFDTVTAILVRMGDKSPKSKQRGQKQKNIAKAESGAAAKAKQAGYSHASAPVTPGKR